MKKLLFAISICGITHQIEPLKESLPPESDVVHSASTGLSQLHYRGATPVIFFRKGALVMDATSAITNAQLGLPTKSNETPTVKLMADRQYRFSMGQMAEDGRIQGQGWQIEEGTKDYPLISDAPPALSEESLKKLWTGEAETRQAVAPLPYYYGRELRKIDLIYTFKKIPGFDGRKCLKGRGL